MLESLSHIALVVTDPARTAALFHELFSARVVERKDDEGHLETFIRPGGTWIVLVATPVQRTRSGDHIAFHATPEILDATAAKLQAMGREFIPLRSSASKRSALSSNARLMITHNPSRSAYHRLGLRHRLRRASVCLSPARARFQIIT